MSFPPAEQPLLRSEHPEYRTINADVDAAQNNFPSEPVSTLHTFVIITSLTCITITSSISTGLLTVGLPRIAWDLQLPEHLLLWPNSVYPLASGSCLLFAGSLADLTSSRTLNLLGTFFLSIFILFSGLAQTGIQLILARTAQGVAVAFCLPTSVAIITNSFPNGRRRNIGFSCLGLAQPLGFSVGLVLEGLIEDTILGWRAGFIACAIATLILAMTNACFLPMAINKQVVSWTRVRREIDWVGMALSSTCLGTLSYICALLTESLDNIHRPGNIVLLSMALTLFPAFVFWMDRQEKLGRPALVPNSLWKNTAFVSICLMVLLSWAVVQSMELFLSLFFQKVQFLTSLEASLRLLPNIIIGIFLNITTGLFIQHIQVNFLIVLVSVIASVSPLLMAIIDPAWSWWSCAFWAVLLGPVSVDVIFTIAHLVVIDAFPSDTHALAGAVFNTVAQFGTSLGLAVMAVISSSATKASGFPVETSPEALMVGYRAVFWTCFGMMIVTCFIGGVGFRKLHSLGQSKESMPSS